MPSLEKMVTDKLESSASTDDLFQVIDISANLLQQGSIEESFFLYVCALAQFRMGETDVAFQLMTQALELAPTNDELYIAKSFMIGSVRGEAVDLIMTSLQQSFTTSISGLTNPEISLALIFDNLGFTEAEDPTWKEAVFNFFALPLLQRLINERMAHLALYVESEIFRRYLRTGGTDYEERFIRSTRKWYPSMERLGQTLAIEKKLQQNDAVRLYNNKLAFFIHSESMLAHIGTVFSILESYKQRGHRGFEVKVISFSGNDPEMRRKFQDYNVEVISLEKLYPNTEWHQRFIKLKEILEEQEIEVLVWVCLTVSMSFAFGLRVAPVQIWYTGSYYRGLTNTNIDRRILNTILADEVFEGNNSWDILNFSVANLCKSLDDVRDEVAAIKRELLGEKFNNVIGVMAREQKLQDKAYIEAIANVLRRHPDTIFVWTGTSCDETISEHINEFGIADQCRYLGWVDTAMYVHILDVFMDTFPFPCGVTLYQAMAAGKASVSLCTNDALSMGIHGQLLSAFESRSDFHFTAQNRARLREIFGEDGDLFLLTSSVDEYVDVSSMLLSNIEAREAVGRANEALAHEFLLDPVKMSISFDRIIDEYRREVPNSTVLSSG